MNTPTLSNQSPGNRLRQAVLSRDITPFIGVYDVFSATLAGQHFDALFISGFGFAASFYGLPDIGFITWSDIVSYVQRIRTVLPAHHLLVDIDDGYCDPEVASVGLTEAKAKEAGYDVKVGKFPFSASGKARIIGEEEGFVKVVSEKKYDEVLGVHIIGPHATELIAEACVAMQLETTAEELGNTMHAHPTVSEAVMEAAEGVHDKTIHI